MEQQEVVEEVHRAAATSAESESVERLALANPTTMQRVEEATRERKAMARLLELATGDSRNGGKTDREKTAEQAETSDTERQGHETPAPAAPAEED